MVGAADNGSMNLRRQPKGVPVGGQFAASAHDEAVTPLDEDAELGRRLMEDESIPAGGISPAWFGRSLALGVPMDRARRAVEKYLGIESDLPEGVPFHPIETISWKDSPYRRVERMDVPWMLRVNAEGKLIYRYSTKAHSRRPELEEGYRFSGNPYDASGTQSMGVQRHGGGVAVFLTNKDAERMANPNSGTVMWSGDEEDIPVTLLVRLDEPPLSARTNVRSIR